MSTAVLACLVPAPGLHAQQRVQETVVVTGTAVPLPFDTLSRSVRVVSREELAHLPLASPADALRVAAGVDVRARGTHGVQADFSVRGAGFGQVLVLVDGVRLNNAQTGHHNGDWPVTLDQVERVEVLLGPGASLYGADAVGGTINIVTRRASGTRSASAAAGAHGFVRGGVSAGVGGGRVRHHLSVDAGRSSGFEFARDFRTVTAGARTTVGARTGIDVGFADKAFGANGFYGPSPSREWTRQVTASVAHTVVDRGGRGLTAHAAYRTHGDRFLWDVRRPGQFENRHRTHAASLAVRGHAQVTPRWRVAGGVEQAGDWIDSSNLGDHGVARTGAFAEAQVVAGPRATAAAGLRVDRYTTFGTAWSPSVSAGLWVASAVRVRGSVGHAFRVPTFTERFYRDPAHAASPQLGPERAWAGEVALDWVPHGQWLVTASAFDRRERDAIDWVKARPGDLWVTRNAFGECARVSVDYAFTDVSPGALALLSKYTLDYARHGLSVSASAPLGERWAVGGRLDARQRTGRDAYALVDLRVSRRFGAVTAHLDATNLLDVRYQEVRGVNMPGRWVSAGVEWRPR